MSSPERISERVAEALNERKADGLLRQLEARPAHPRWLNLADNDYLGLAHDPTVISAAAAAAVKWGASASASPLITGYTELHAALERALASWHGYQHGLVWNSGFAANSAVLGMLPKRGDVVLADRLIHASMVAGIMRSGARLRRFPHNDLHALQAMLAEEAGRDGAVFVVTESIYSMDGDCPDLAALAKLRGEHGFFWVLDEAHATGWFGETGAGALEAHGCLGEPDVLVSTLGKALGSQGACTFFRDVALRECLLNEASEFVYSTCLAPPAAGAALAALQRVRELAPEREVLHTLSRSWRAAMQDVGAKVPDGDSPIVPVLLGSAERAVKVQRALLERGFRVSCIRPPTVPDGTARLRVSLRRGLTDGQRVAFAAALKDALACA
ncbi:MAG TPA: 8-amino-7-oxononanoate synthase [Verrucomicrobiae bacterium]|nr:8-amino-7-oxononanoate synthase [Verrucomicrobiae bacterium]